MRKKPKILITTGDPKGIGPEVTEKALMDRHIKTLANFVVITPADATGLDAIKKAAIILKDGCADGIVTAPVNKYAINKSGIDFRGHTEYLACTAGIKKFAMMFCSGRLRVVIVTRHIALKDVPLLLSRDRLAYTIRLTEHALRRYFNLREPRIGICGLNPHCGESGLMGDEEQEIIMPVIKRLKPAIPGIQGPLPADVVFYKAYTNGLDVVISMYHDQGLGPFKMVAFENGVNVTLGLPFIRTSPGHGTAYDIAGKGIANPCSMKEAIKLAVSMCGSKGC